MSDPRITKAELVERLVEKNEEIDRLRQAAKVDPDAAAINACVKALDPLAESRNRSLTYLSAGPSASVDRVLLYLRHRYGIPDASAERDGLKAELEQAHSENARLRDRLAAISQVTA